MSERDIVFRFVSTNYFTRWPCTVCGGCTEKVGVLTEADTPEGTIRVCETCLKDGDLDDKLLQQANDLTDRSAYLMCLTGRLKAPSYAAWEEAELRDDCRRSLDRAPTDEELATVRERRMRAAVTRQALPNEDALQF